MSLQACEAYGGTFCPNHNPCDDLKSCIETEIAWAKGNNRSTYEAYLNDAPSLNDTESADQCGMTREYFGHQDGFINDLQVCDDIQQMKHSRDFAFLDGFYGQGSGGDDSGGGDNGGEDGCSCQTASPTIPAIDTDAPTRAPVTSAPTLPPVPELVLTKPDRAKSMSGEVQNEAAWFATNFVMTQVAKQSSQLLEMVEHIACPADFTGISATICAAFKNALQAVLRFILNNLQLIVDISEHTYHQVATLRPREQFEMEENVQALVKSNLNEIGDYLQANFQSMGDGINGLAKLMDTVIERQSRRNLLGGSELAEISLRVKIVNQSPKAFLCLTTLGGTPSSPEMMELTTFDWSSKDNVQVLNFSMKELSPGQLLVEIPDSYDGDVFTLTIFFQDKISYEMVSTNDLISFQSCVA